MTVSEMLKALENLPGRQVKITGEQQKVVEAADGPLCPLQYACQNSQSAWQDTFDLLP
jgi:hypothetical protein